MQTPEHPAPEGALAPPVPGCFRFIYLNISARKGTSTALASHVERLGDWPVKGVKIYPRDVRVKKVEMFGADRPEKWGAREVITEFSDKSRRALAFFISNCGVNFRSMITITYPKEFPCDGALVKKHLRALHERFRRKFGKFTAVWFLEFQKRGAPHFHLLCALELVAYGDMVQKKSRVNKKRVYWTCLELESWLAHAWYEIVGSADEKHLRAGVSWEVVEKEDGAQRYAWTHASKPHQKKVPVEYYSVGRFWAAWGIPGLEKHLLEELEGLEAADIFDRVGHEGLSSKGRLKRDLYGATEKFYENNSDSADIGAGKIRET